MQIKEFLPIQGCFTPGEKVVFKVEIESEQDVIAVLAISIRHLDEVPNRIVRPLRLGGWESLQVEWQPPFEPAGYGATAELFDEAGKMISQVDTSFDVLDKWSDFPRYGFLTDFSAERPDPEATIMALNRFHINGLQFYDWQFRHDKLLAPATDYTDPLGRHMSLAAIQNLVVAAGNHGMAAMPYLAVYAASAKFWREHLEAALYDRSGQPIPFGEDFLGLMNPEEGSAWRGHLLEECAKALKAISFAGLHIDQYGEPKEVWDAAGQQVNLPAAFSGFIRAARAQHPEKTILFNAVGNWPIKDLAASPLDFMYIEIWPPDVHYHDVAKIVLEAVSLSGGKPVVIALYLPADRPENVMQANAIIAACGGTRIELGENNRLLTDPYFPKHQAISPELENDLSHYYDYLVEYGEWMQSYSIRTDERQIWAQARFKPEEIIIDQAIWAVARQYPNGLAVNLVNFNGLEPEQTWDKPHASPSDCREVTVRIKAGKRPEKILWAYPEQTEGPETLNFDYENEHITFRLPSLKLLGVIFIHD